MPDRPRLRLGKVRRRVAESGAVSYSVALDYAQLETAYRESLAWRGQGLPLVRLVFFPVTKGEDAEMVAYLEPRVGEAMER